MEDGYDTVKMRRKGGITKGTGEERKGTALRMVYPNTVYAILARVSKGWPSVIQPANVRQCLSTPYNFGYSRLYKSTR